MPPASQDDRINDLVDLWEEKRLSGEAVTPETLCRDCPQLASEVGRRIQALIAMDRLVNRDANAPDSLLEGTDAATSATMPQVHYTDLRFHAEGGLGQVFTALGNDLSRRVALKFIRPRRAADAESRRRFLFEVEVTGRLEHPGVVPVYGLGADDRGLPCYAMRLIGGETLQEALEAFHADERPGRDPVERARALRPLLLRFISVCNTMAYAHNHSVLHRDLKPKNIMLGAFGETLVVDWGLAKPIAGDSLEANSGDGVPPLANAANAALTMGPIGSPGYMSPEQARNELLTIASDIYSLGAMLYAVLTSRPPFTGSTVEVLELTRRNEFPPARAVSPAVHPALEAVCGKAMATRPENRYIDALALATDIDRWLADAPVSAWRDPPFERARRWARRNRTAVTASGAALLAALIGLAALAIVQARHNTALAKAHDDTTRALRQSEESRKKAEAVLTFLKNDVLAAARPEREEGGLGIDVTIRKAVDATEPKIADEFKDQPAVEADIRDTLGVTYLYVGEPLLAIRQHQRAMELRRTTLGPMHPDTLNSWNKLAAAYLNAGRTAEAIELHQATLKQLESTLGVGHPDTLASRNNLALAYRAAGRSAEAIALDEATLKIRESMLGGDHPDTLISRSNLAGALWSAGRTAEAIALDEETLKRRESKFGRDHPDTLISRGNLASAYWSAGRIADAIVLGEETLKLRESKLGRDHPATLTSRNNLAAAYVATGRTAEAIALDEETLKLRELKLGGDHPDTLVSRNNLAQAYLAASRVSEAIGLHERTLKRRELKLGPDHPLTLASRNNLAQAYLAAGRWADAELLSHDLIERLRSVSVPNSDLLAAALGVLGFNHLLQSKWPEAETVLRDSLALRDKSTPDAWLRFNTMSQLGGALLGQGRHAEAAPLVISGYVGLKAREEKIPAVSRARLFEASVRVVELYESWGKSDEAASWKARLGLRDLPADVFARP